MGVYYLQTFSHFTATQDLEAKDEEEETEPGCKQTYPSPQQKPEIKERFNVSANVRGREHWGEKALTLTGPPDQLKQEKASLCRCWWSALGFRV